MAADAHDHIVWNPGLPHVRDGAMPEIMEMKPLDPSPPTRRVEVRLYVQDAFTLEGKHVWAPQG